MPEDEPISNTDSVPPETAAADNQEDRKESIDDYRIDPDNLSDSVSGQSGDPNKDPDRNEEKNSDVKEADSVLGTKTEQRIDRFLLKISNTYCLRSCSEKNKVSEETIGDLEIGKNTVIVVNKHFPDFKWLDSPEANLGLGVIGLSTAIIVNRVIDSYEKGKIESESLNKFLDLVGIEKTDMDIREPEVVV